MRNPDDEMAVRHFLNGQPFKKSTVKVVERSVDGHKGPCIVLCEHDVPIAVRDPETDRIEVNGHEQASSQVFYRLKGILDALGYNLYSYSSRWYLNGFPAPRNSWLPVSFPDFPVAVEIKGRDLAGPLTERDIQALPISTLEVRDIYRLDCQSGRNKFLKVAGTELQMQAFLLGFDLTVE